ncbi:FitA-like ribbon-helix-helix domain-containing protein [Nesterenkonia muleiensis]|uniref:FitA-like ribbon-helix-helix domain-containing protein n=1 Tax=Nesterenkonia muleiensis TaxID=2282648 RepID=UPI000E752591|nr:toxin-antitoxin system, antitoxin component [Nesterenkonia muleiensis]
MSMIQLRNVPEDMHRELKARAAQRGMTLSEYATRELQKVLEIPNRQEIIKRVAALTPVVTTLPAAEVIREARDSR